jgi:DNA-binding MurR/RpiR family transcriptional regulator
MTPLAYMLSFVQRAKSHGMKVCSVTSAAADPLACLHVELSYKGS